MGETEKPKKRALADTMDVRMHVRWDETAQATPPGAQEHVQLIRPWFADSIRDGRHMPDSESAYMAAIFTIDPS